jgi:hypothetical protein
VSYSSVVSLILADVPNPPPADPTGGAPGLGQIIAYIKYGSLTLCGAGAVASFGALAIGHFTSRPEAKQFGKYGLATALLAAIGIAIAIPAVNTVFGAAS